MKSSVFFLSLFMISTVRANPIEIPPINFGGGFNILLQPSDIADNETPDCSNMVNTIQGSAVKRGGSRRYIEQAISSNPVNSIFRVYASTATEYKKAIVMTSKDSIYFSTNDANPQWIQVSSGLSPNQHFQGVVMGNELILSGDRLTDSIKKFNILTASMTNLADAGDGSTNTLRLRSKTLLNARGFLLAGNVAEVSSAPALTASVTYYPSRVYYSQRLDPLLLQVGSFTAARFLEIRTDDGESITGLSELNRFVHIWKETSITELEFTTLNLGGDQVLRQIVQGFGLYAPRTLANIGDFYIFGAKDGLRIWDGSRKTRLNLEQESRIVSLKIKPIIDRLIKAGTYRSSMGKYYPKRQWYIFAFEDPDKNPRGRLNSVMVFDIPTASWFPFNNWLAECFETMDGIGDKGELLYGDSSDGYIHVADIDELFNDSRKEIVLDTMDSSFTWTRSRQETETVIEGTASLKIWLSDTVTISSITKMAVFNIGEFYDKSLIDSTDKISFKVFVSTIGNLSSLRVDLERNDITGDFDSNFSSITISSASLSAGNTSWATVEVAIASFPIRNDWVNLSSETLPFSRASTIYGIRFVAQGIGLSTVTIDDLRLIQNGENPLNSYFLTKQFNFGTAADKRFRQVILNRELSSDSKLNIDVLSDFGKSSKRIDQSGKFPKELFVAGFGGTNTITKISASDFSVISSTQSDSDLYFDIRFLVSDDKFIYAADKSNDRLLKFDRSSMTVIVSSFGSLGSGTSNFDTIHQIAIDDKNVYAVDVSNNRIKVHKKDNFEFVNSFGSLGLGASSFHNLTGVAVDGKFVYVADEGNFALKKISKSTSGVVLVQNYNVNTVGETSLAVDESHIYDAYESVTLDQRFQDIILEKRSKEDLKLLKRVIVRPKGIAEVELSSYAVQGAISISDDFIYLTFADSIYDEKNYYIQKRLKSDFSLVKEFKTTKRHWSCAAIGLSAEPKRKNIVEDLDTEGGYLQLKYSESGLDNNLKLFSQSFLIIGEPIKEK